MFSQNFPGVRRASVWPVISDRKLSDIGPIYASAHQITQGLFPFPRITLSVPGKVASPCVGSVTKKLFLTKSDRIFRSTLSATGCKSVFINFNSKCWMHRTYMCSFFAKCWALSCMVFTAFVKVSRLTTYLVKFGSFGTIAQPHILVLTIMGPYPWSPRRQKVGSMTLLKPVGYL